MMRYAIPAVLLLAMSGGAAGEKTASVLMPPELTARAQANAAAHDWARGMADAIVQQAQPWLEADLDMLWGAVFGPGIERSWMVWSDGFCPACENDVRMYAWLIDPWKHPWKVQCPHCAELFPKNDFAAFRQSGLNEQGFFDPDRADRSLLVNPDHPDPADPRHTFGVDDGTGYVNEAGQRWRFIGAYMIYGQWKQLVQGGIVRLADAYAVTGDPEYAFRAALLLDRVADAFPFYNFNEQGYVYERADIARGQVSQWHDACEEVRQLALAYDAVFEGARDQSDRLTAYIAEKAGAYTLEPRTTWAEIQAHIETNIFRHTLANRPLIESNRPRTDLAVLVMETVLNWPANRSAVLDQLDAIIETDTQVDGVSGEKGTGGYAAIAPSSIAMILGRFSRLEPGFLETMLERHPVLRDTWRFHIDLRCLDDYYPHSGDSGGFGRKTPGYVGVNFSANPGTNPSMYSFMMDLYALTGDVQYLQMVYRDNPAGHPYDLFAENPGGFEAKVQEIGSDLGREIALPSLNKGEWHLAILRSGEAAGRRALWLDYDSGGRHGHADGLNLGYFAHGLEVLPEFGYPAVGYGGWDSEYGLWYTRSAAHNTVVIDGKDHLRRIADGEGRREPRGEVTLWHANGDAPVQAMRVAAAELADGAQRFERTVALIDIDETDAYVLDVVRVAGGEDHAFFLGSLFGNVTAEGLDLAPAEDFGNNTLLRNTRADADPETGWHVDWAVEDRYGYLKPGQAVHLRYTGLTAGAEAALAEAWIDPGQFGVGQEEWVPRLIVRRRGSAPLSSTFAGLIESYDRTRKVQSVARLIATTPSGAPLPDTVVCVEVTLADGQRDLLLVTDPELPPIPIIRAGTNQFEDVPPGTLVFRRGQTEHRITPE